MLSPVWLLPQLEAPPGMGPCRHSGSRFGQPAPNRQFPHPFCWPWPFGWPQVVQLVRTVQVGHRHPSLLGVSPRTSTVRGQFRPVRAHEASPNGTEQGNPAPGTRGTAPVAPLRGDHSIQGGRSSAEQRAGHLPVSAETPVQAGLLPEPSLSTPAPSPPLSPARSLGPRAPGLAAAEGQGGWRCPPRRLLTPPEPCLALMLTVMVSLHVKFLHTG